MYIVNMCIHSLQTVDKGMVLSVMSPAADAGGEVAVGSPVSELQSNNVLQTTRV